VRLLSLGYAPPEQMLGRAVTPASDVFALGALLVFANTGHLPYPGDTELAVARRMDEPPDLNGVPEPLCDVLGRCLATDPASRPTVAELLMVFGQRSARKGTTLVRLDPPKPAVDRKQAVHRVTGRDTWNGGRRATAREVPVGTIAAAFVAVGLLAVELYWLYRLTHPAPASQVMLPAWLEDLFAFIGGIVWLFVMMMIFCAVCWGGLVVALVLDFHGDELGGEIGSMIHAAACGVWGLGAAVLTAQRTEFRWWADLFVGLAVFVIVLAVSGLAVSRAERRWERPAFATTALAHIDAAVLAGLLIWGLDKPVWPAAGLAGVGWVGLATVLTLLHAVPRGRHPSIVI
jgi:hypothetical protein